MIYVITALIIYEFWPETHLIQSINKTIHIYVTVKINFFNINNTYQKIATNSYINCTRRLSIFNLATESEFKRQKLHKPNHQL